ncbi:MAG: hypothetical protein NTZ56_09475 [Acidobacteria bacterium]|nr:hypothetical protein [Acidobacteriota bacterium]
MEKVTRQASARKNGVELKRVSELGKELRKISDSYVAKGGKLLNRRELERELAERRS